MTSSNIKIAIYVPFFLLSIYLLVAHFFSIGYIFPDNPFDQGCASKSDGDFRKIIIDNHEIAVPNQNVVFCFSPYLTVITDSEPHSVELSFKFTEEIDSNQTTAGEIKEFGHDATVNIHFFGTDFPPRHKKLTPTHHRPKITEVEQKFLSSVASSETGDESQIYDRLPSNGAGVVVFQKRSQDTMPNRVYVFGDAGNENFFLHCVSHNYLETPKRLCHSNENFLAGSLFFEYFFFETDTSQMLDVDLFVLNIISDLEISEFKRFF